MLTEENNDLVIVAKTWIQAPKDSTPIEFEEVWNLDGSTHRGAAKQRLEKVFGDLCKYGLANTLDMVKIFTMVEIGSGAKREVETWRMSYNVFKHYISSSQTEPVNTTRAFHKCVANFGLLEGSEYKSLKIFIPNKPGRPWSTFKMTVGAAIDWPYWDTNHFHLSHGINMWNRL